MNINECQDKLIFECISGSRAYGTSTPKSDTDIRGVFILPASQYFRLNGNVEQVSDSTNDITYYTLKRFFQLAADANPNILELLFMPEDCVVKTSPEWKRVLEKRQSFISKRVLATYSGYAVSQIKRARGQNKLVNNPMPETKPVKEDFCWVFPLRVLKEPPQNGKMNYHLESDKIMYPDKMPFRPLKLNESEIDLSLCHCAAVEHAIDMYRLYDYGDKAKGVFRGDESADIVCESIPKEDEVDKFKGILIYHKEAYERELKLWQQYWDWKKNRNETRWQDQENKMVNYDSKNLAHCMRLLYEAEHILQYGFPKVRFEGEQLQKLKEIRFTRLPYEEIIAEAEERLAQLEEYRKTCTLPNSADIKTLSDLLVELNFERHENN
ncbi:MAG: nucleotidyltransferase domain-containing protein [Planctomycetaceae bacterium]|jgi:predicted nucleotidyltransferase|nr:nucleotidyltransferase domain-containing protein [Planctomycetaceae bacterium]